MAHELMLSTLNYGALAAYAAVAAVAALAIFILARFVWRAVRTVGCGHAADTGGPLRSTDPSCPTTLCANCPMSAHCASAPRGTKSPGEDAAGKHTP